MPVPIVGQLVQNGISSIPYAEKALYVWLPWVLGFIALRWFFGGAKNDVDRIMHGRVIMITGGTSGVGEIITHDLASKGAQLILLVRSIHDSWTVDYINDLRERHKNLLIYAEECDLSSLHSIRVFCTKWLDNAPPRRLDGIVLAAGVMAPPFTPRTLTKDGVESHWGINYLANYHLLTLLAPALKVQPPDRDVRVLVATCASYMLGALDLNDPQFDVRGYPSGRPWQVYGASKLALMAFVREFQTHINAYKRPDKAEVNCRVYNVDPGWMRSPGTRRWISCGRILGLLGYLVTWPLWFLVLKNTEEGAQSFLHGLYHPNYAKGTGGDLLRECQIGNYRHPGLRDPNLGPQLYEVSKKMVEELEKKDAVKRALKKAEADAKEGKTTTVNSKPSPKESSITATDTPKKSKSAANRNKKVSFME